MSELIQARLIESGELPAFRGESYEEHVSTWLTVDESVQGHFWMLGAIAASLDKKYGEDIMGKFASDVRSSRTRIREYAATYKAWENNDRSAFLSFKHHTIAARSEDPPKVLAIAEEQEFSTRELEEFVQTGELPARSVHFSSDSTQWYTPPHIIERVRRSLGSIELDPCAEPEKTVPALNHFTEQDDGLSREWHGTVYMNPPYGKGDKGIVPWIKKLLEEYESGRVTAALALVPSRTDTAWFTMLRDYPRCFIRGRLKFSGYHNSASFPSAAFYLGDDEAAFIRAFEDLGDIFRRVEW